MDSSILVAAVLVIAGILAIEFGLSGAITEVVAGVLLGVWVGGRDLGWLDLLGHFGLLGLMFMAGFEVDTTALRRRLGARMAVGLPSFLLPMAGVFSLCRWGLDLEPEVAGVLGIGLSTTSLALVYQYLRERDMLGHDAGQTILAAAMVVDVLSMAGLSMLLGHAGWATAIFAALAIPLFWGLPRVGGWIFARYGGSAVEFELRFLLLMPVGLGVLAERVGIHAAVVSFLAGLVLSRAVQDHEALEDKLKGVVFSLFAPVFFLRAGTQLDVRAADLGTLGVTGVPLLVAVGLKYLGTSLPARWCVEGGGHFVGVLFNYRLSFGIIAALPMIRLRDLPSEVAR